MAQGSPDTVGNLHRDNRLLQVALPDGEGFTKVGRAITNLAPAEYHGTALWALHSAVPGCASTVLAAMPRSHANLGLLDAIPPARNGFDALLEAEPVAMLPVQHPLKLGFW